ncbi:MAG: hypothetical protein J5912_01530 [Clostridia bacterium]|nr:hypothetical protein [Clostridia bacterium]
MGIPKGPVSCFATLQEMPLRAVTLRRDKEGRILKNVIVSADNELKVYLVPDFVADSFDRLCADFSRNWETRQPPRLDEAEGGFDEKSFIDYLNESICGDEKCVFIETLGWDYRRKKWPEKYRNCPYFNF